MNGIRKHARWRWVARPRRGVDAREDSRESGDKNIVAELHGRRALRQLAARKLFDECPVFFCPLPETRHTRKSQSQFSTRPDLDVLALDGAKQPEIVNHKEWDPAPEAVQSGPPNERARRKDQRVRVDHGQQKATDGACDGRVETYGDRSAVIATCREAPARRRGSRR